MQLLVLSNGPISSLDPLTSSFAKLPTFLQKLYLHPYIAHRYLRSSLGLRRLVVNPYVMDHDTVVALCHALFDPKIRTRYLDGLQQLISMENNFNSQAKHHMAIWGDQDLLYPTKIASTLQNRIPDLKRIDILGGKFLHPIERPWAIADTLHQGINELRVT